MRIILLAALLATHGCISEETAAEETEDASVGEQVDGGDEDGGPGQGNRMEGDDGSLDPPPPVPDAGDPVVDAAPPPPPMGNPCQDFCDRFDECFAPQCPALPNSEMICRRTCSNLSDDQLSGLAAAECGDFNATIYGFAPQLERFCSDEPPPEGCDEVCDLFERCGGGDRAQCEGTCRALDESTLECVRAADECQDLAGCFNMMQPPDDAERCENYCNRQAVCTFRECAAGTLPDGWTGECRETCEADPPSQEEMAWVFDQICDDVVVGVRARDEGIDGRCENEPEAVCTLLCRETIVPCSDALDQAACEAECEAFDEANLRCVQLADGCDEVSACYGDPEGQARCNAFCDRLQSCLLEACPPRIIPPELSVGCTAGCLDSPPPEEQAEVVANASCREVRQLVYQRNRQLAPICEGGRDFRPSPEECVAFCDNSLQACIGVGGRQFCLAACASLDRDQYQCALEAQGNCNEIAVCLEDVEE